MKIENSFFAFAIFLGHAPGSKQKNLFREAPRVLDGSPKNCVWIYKFSVKKLLA